MDIQKQIVIARARANYLSLQSDPTDSVMHRENADTMEKLLAVYEAAQELHDAIDADSYWGDQGRTMSKLDSALDAADAEQE